MSDEVICGVKSCELSTFTLMVIFYLRTRLPHVFLLAWRSISLSKPCLRKGVRWKIGDGQHVHLLKDWWVGTCPIVEAHPETANSVANSMLVKDIIGVHGGWDLSNVSRFSRRMFWRILGECSLLRLFIRMTQVVGSSNGSFSVSSAYSVLSSDGLHDSEDLSWIWKIPCPERVPFFIWLLYQDKLNTNVLRCRKGFTLNACCSN